MFRLPVIRFTIQIFKLLRRLCVCSLARESTVFLNYRPSFTRLDNGYTSHHDLGHVSKLFQDPLLNILSLLL